MDSFRRSHQDEKKHPSDYCMRALEAILAKSAGFSNRCDWTDILRETIGTKYNKDYNSIELIHKF